MRQNMRTAVNLVAGVVVLVGFVNFWVVMAANHRLGGAADVVRSGGGRYYVQDAATKKYAEVSAEAWEANRRLNNRMVVTSLAAAASFMYIVVQTLPKVWERGAPEAVAQAVADVRASGKPLYSAQTWGGLGGQNVYLGVDVYPAGVVLTPRAGFIGPRYPPLAIRAAEITRLTVKRYYLQNRTFIAHRSNLVSRMVYISDTSDAFLAALRAITSETTR